MDENIAPARGETERSEGAPQGAPGDSEPKRQTISDPVVMRALAHPARLAILEHLTGGGGPITATEAAQLVGLSPSATSYHLRELAKVGMIEDAPGRGDGRERVWQSPHKGLSFKTGQDAPPESRAAERALVDLFMAREQERLEAWFDRSQDEPTEWFEAAFLAESILLVTAEELGQLLNKVTEVLEPYKRSVRQENPPEGVRKVSFQMRGVPID